MVYSESHALARLLLLLENKTHQRCSWASVNHSGENIHPQNKKKTYQRRSLHLLTIESIPGQGAAWPSCVEEDWEKSEEKNDWEHKVLDKCVNISMLNQPAFCNSPITDISTVCNHQIKWLIFHQSFGLIKRKYHVIENSYRIQSSGLGNKTSASLFHLCSGKESWSLLLYNVFYSLFCIL